MPTNIEIKARLEDPTRAHALAAAMSDAPVQKLRQCDTFFGCMTGRLKLRELDDGHAELISYSRPDRVGVKRSDYEVAPVNDPMALRAVLAAALGVTQTVKKTRSLYLVGQTRVHIDSVDGLGDFLELEVVLRPGQHAADGQAIAVDLMRRLGIGDCDLCSIAYADMVSAAAAE